MPRPTKYSTEQKDQAVQIALARGSLRAAVTETGVKISAIRLHARATGVALPRNGQRAARHWAHQTAARVLDGIDLTAAALDAGIDPDRAAAELALIVNDLRSQP